MIIFLLIIIAVGVLLLSEPGQALLGLSIVWGVRIFLVLLVGTILIITYLYLSEESSKTNTSVQTPKTTQPVDVTSWDNEPKTQTTKTPNLCVTEYGVKICELGYNQDPTDYSYRLNIGGNTTTCIDAVTSNYLETKSGYANKLNNPQFCVSDWGNVELNNTLQVKKYWGQIVRDTNYERVYVPRTYRACIWTYSAGTAVAPYLEIYKGSNGPLREYAEDNIRAFCLSGTNQVDFYTYGNSQ